MARIVGIDLGTTYSAVAIVGSLGKPELLPNREGDRITPSVVLFQGDMTLVGAMAKRSAATSPDDVVQFVKRKMGDETWKFSTSDGRTFGAEQISAIILKRLKEDAELLLGEPVTDAVITVPAYFDDARRKATQDAGTMAGLNVRRVLNEPTAAALAYGLDSQASGTLLVYDLGGGTFDVTIMRIGDGIFDVLSTMGDRELGGFHWDNALMTFANDQVMAAGGPNLLDNDLTLAELRDKSEMLKRSLTTLTEAKIFLSVNGNMQNVTITREQFETMTRGLLGRTEDITEQALEDANLTWSDIDRILLVGGSTRMPMVHEMMTRLSGKTPEKGFNPDEAVALGAAIQGHICSMDDDDSNLPVLSGARGKIEILDVCAMGLGVIALDERHVDRNFILVQHNSKVPAFGSSDFSTVVENQKALNIRITEGDDEDPRYVKIIGESNFDMPEYPKGAPIRIEINFDIDGLVHAQAFDGTTNKKIGDMEIDRISNLTKSELEEAKRAIDDMEVN